MAFTMPTRRSSFIMHDEADNMAALCSAKQTHMHWSASHFWRIPSLLWKQIPYHIHAHTHGHTQSFPGVNPFALHSCPRGCWLASLRGSYHFALDDQIPSSKWPGLRAHDTLLKYPLFSRSCFPFRDTHCPWGIDYLLEASSPLRSCFLLKRAFSLRSTFFSRGTSRPEELTPSFGRLYSQGLDFLLEMPLEVLTPSSRRLCLRRFNSLLETSDPLRS